MFLGSSITNNFARLDEAAIDSESAYVTTRINSQDALVPSCMYGSKNEVVLCTSLSSPCTYLYRRANVPY
jgi:hypothetical protein